MHVLKHATHCLRKNIPVVFMLTGMWADQWAHPSKKKNSDESVLKAEQHASVTGSRDVLTPKVSNLKIILTRIGKDTHTHSLSSLLGPVSVMDGESVAYSCIQLTNCPPPITAPSPPCDLWKMGRDGMSRQLRLEKGQRGWRRTKEVNLEKIIYLRVYRPPRCGWAPSACEHTYVWARLETRFSHDLAASRTARTFLFVVCWW